MRILRSLRNWIIKPICWKEGCNWLLFIPYRGCLFKLMIFSNQSIVSDLPSHLQALYCWNRIRYYENLIKYTDDARFASEYLVEKEAYRDTVMSILYDASEEYSKERAIKLQDQGNTKEALKILTKIYQKEKTRNIMGFAMMSMGLSRAYRWSESMNWKKSILY